MNAIESIAAEDIERDVSSAGRFTGIVVGEVIGVADGGATPLVAYARSDGPAVARARTIVDVHGAHIGRQVALMFAGGDPAQPIVIGVIRESDGCLVDVPPGQVDVSADGERLTVAAKEQLVLRCGRASITLTKAGKVLIDGAYVSSRSSGVARIRGATVEIN